MFSIFDFYVLVDEIYKKAPLTGHTRFGHPIGSLTWFNRSIETFLFNFFLFFFLFNFLNSIWSYLRDFIWIGPSHITLISIKVRSLLFFFLLHTILAFCSSGPILCKHNLFISLRITAMLISMTCKNFIFKMQNKINFYFNCTFY